jgi:hypothetical protein
MTPEQIENIFTYHAPDVFQAERYEKIREEGRRLAVTLLRLCPESAERTKAIRNLQQTIMWANASIAINES